MNDHQNKDTWNSADERSEYRNHIGRTDNYTQQQGIRHFKDRHQHISNHTDNH